MGLPLLRLVTSCFFPEPSSCPLRSFALVHVSYLGWCWRAQDRGYSPDAQCPVTVWVQPAPWATCPVMFSTLTAASSLRTGGAGGGAGGRPGCLPHGPALGPALLPWGRGSHTGGRLRTCHTPGVLSGAWAVRLFRRSICLCLGQLLGVPQSTRDRDEPCPYVGHPHPHPQGGAGLNGPGTYQASLPRHTCAGAQEATTAEPTETSK